LKTVNPSFPKERRKTGLCNESITHQENRPRSSATVGKTTRPDRHEINICYVSEVVINIIRNCTKESLHNIDSD
jgi:hypothetical protein